MAIQIGKSDMSRALAIVGKHCPGLREALPRPVAISLYFFLLGRFGEEAPEEFERHLAAIETIVTLNSNPGTRHIVRSRNAREVWAYLARENIVVARPIKRLKVTV